MGRLFCYLVTLPLADEYTIGVSGVATKEREQQIQGWEAEAFDFGAAAWACASY